MKDHFSFEIRIWKTINCARRTKNHARCTFKGAKFKYSKYFMFIAKTLIFLQRYCWRHSVNATSHVQLPRNGYALGSAPICDANKHIEWSRRAISIVACCRSVQLCFARLLPGLSHRNSTIFLINENGVFIVKYCYLHNGMQRTKLGVLKASYKQISCTSLKVVSSRLYFYLFASMISPKLPLLVLLHLLIILTFVCPTLVLIFFRQLSTLKSVKLTTDLSQQTF